jgi:WD40 repeat protein
VASTGTDNKVITALAWSPTRPELAVGGYSGLVQLWQADGPPRLARSLTGLQPLLGLPEAIQALTFSPDGQRLAASDSNETPDDTVSLAVGDHDVDA